MHDQSIRDALDALSGLPPEQLADALIWFSGEHSGQTDVNHLPDTSFVRIFPYSEYSLNSESEATLPANINASEIIQLLKNTTGHWGTLTELWVVIRLDNKPMPGTGRLLLIEKEGLYTFLDQLFSKDTLTRAEKLILIQVVCGQKLKEAAVNDGLSWETKRKQFKSVSLKTGITSQGELASYVVAQLLMSLHERYSKDEKHAAFRMTAERYMAGGSRTLIVTDDKGQTHRIIDIGPRRGRAVIVLHSQIITEIVPTFIHALNQHNLRFIFPLRQGQLGPMDEKITFEEYTQHAVAGIDKAIEIFGVEQMTLVCVQSGYYFGLRYAETYPEKLNQIIFFCASYKTEPAMKLGNLRRKYLALLMKNEWLLDKVMNYVRQKIKDPRNLKALMKDDCKGSVDDLRIIDELFDDPARVEALQNWLLQSGTSIRQEYKILGSPDWSGIYDNPHQKHFIHGQSDSVYPLQNVKELASELGASVTPIPGVGQMFLGNKIPLAVDAIAEFLDGSRSHVRFVKK